MCTNARWYREVLSRTSIPKFQSLIRWQCRNLLLFPTIKNQLHSLQIRKSYTIIHQENMPNKGRTRHIVAQAKNNLLHNLVCKKSVHVNCSLFFYKAGVYWNYILSILPCYLGCNFQHTPDIEKRMWIRCLESGWLEKYAPLGNLHPSAPEIAIKSQEL